MWVDVAILKIVGFGSVALLVLGWLIVSFLKEGAWRARLSRLSSAFHYLALVSLFTNLTQEAWEAGRWVLVVPFGFLLCVFVSGFGVSVVKFIGQLVGGQGESAHAIH